jgi:5-enolpyruvylshikimate-3-phosphate synthase
MQLAAKEMELYTEKEAFFNCAFLAALANGTSIIHEVNPSPEFETFADYLRNLGAQVNINNRQWEITGTNFKHEKPLNLDWLGNDFPHQKRNKKIIECLLNGEPFSCEEKIPVKDSLIRELSTFGAEVKWKLDGPDENDELAKRFAKMQKIKTEKKWVCSISPVPSLLARDRFIPGDATHAAFLALSVSLTPNAEITINAVNLDSSRAGIFGAFKRLGADIEIITRREKGNDVWGDLKVKYAKNLIGRKLSADILSTCIDEIPLLIAMACSAEGESTFKLPSWSINFCKPLLDTLYKNLKTAGIECGIYEEGIILRGKTKIEGEGFDCQNFPVLGMALHVLNKKTKSKESVKGIECVENIYPGALI